MTMTEPQDLLALAKSRDPDDRASLLMGVVGLCETSSAAPEGVGPVLADVFMALVIDAERETRRRLAARIASAAWAPPALVNVLALDEIEIAAPLIAASPVLRNADLIRLLVEATLEHQIAVARRPNIESEVVRAILDQGDPTVMTALAGNDTAELTPIAFARMVEYARVAPSMRAPLSRHPHLPAELGQRLYLWVGEALRQALAQRFRLDPEALQAAIEAASREAFEEPFGPHALDDADRRYEREHMEKRLVDKLAAAGQLRPGYLLRALREGKLTLFEAALVKLGGGPPAEVRRALTADEVEPLATACAAAGVDRSAVATVIALVRGLNGGRPGPRVGAPPPAPHLPVRRA